MGVYGMLAVGIAIFCLRYLVPKDRWSDGPVKFSFWALNLGLAWMSFATLFPLGVLQLYHSVSAGYVEARSLEFLTTGMAVWIEWMRLPGDVPFIGGTLPLIWMGWSAIRHLAQPDDSRGHALCGRAGTPRGRPGPGAFGSGAIFSALLARREWRRVRAVRTALPG